MHKNMHRTLCMPKSRGSRTRNNMHHMTYASKTCTEIWYIGKDGHGHADTDTRTGTDGQFLADSFLRTVSCGQFFADSFLRTVFCGQFFADSFLRTVFCGQFFADSFLRTVFCGQLWKRRAVMEKTGVEHLARFLVERPVASPQFSLS